MSSNIPKIIRIQKPQSIAIPLDIIDNFAELKGAKLSILEFIVRKTLGFRKFYDYISNSQFQKATGYSTSEIINTLNQLSDLSYIEWQYLCPKCDIKILNYTHQHSSRNYQCPNCNTKEPPNKYYNLIMSEEAKEYYKQIWGSIENILPTKESILPLVDKTEKGSVESIVGGSIESITTINTNNTINNKSLSQEGLTKLENTNIIDSQKKREQDNFAKGKKLIEEQYPNYFINNMGGILSAEQRSHIIAIGSFPEDKVRLILKDKAGKAKQPINMVTWTVEELHKNSNGHKKVIYVQVSNDIFIPFDDPKLMEKYGIDPTQENQTRLDLAYLLEQNKGDN